MNLHDTFIVESRKAHPPRWAFLSVLGAISAIENDIPAAVSTALDVLDHASLEESYPVTTRMLLTLR